MKYNILSFIFIIIFTGCSNSEINIDLEKKSKLQIPKQQKIVVRKNGSLYSRQGTSLFADKKDLQIGDILQVVVQETLKNNSKGSRSSKKGNTAALGGGIMTPTVPTGILSSSAKKLTNTVNRNVGIDFKSTSSNTFAGTATSAVDEKFSTTISVIIEQIYQNGNYFVRGSKEMLIDGQKQFLGISGIIRPYDISPENTVYSHQLANLKIKYKKDGEENEVNHKNWGTKIIETIWPF